MKNLNIFSNKCNNCDDIVIRYLKEIQFLEIQFSCPLNKFFFYDIDFYKSTWLWEITVNMNMRKLLVLLQNWELPKNNEYIYNVLSINSE